MKTFANLVDFACATGTGLGPADWKLVDQDHIEAVVRYVR